MNYREEREAVLSAVWEIFDSGLVTGTWGNASARCKGTNMFIITPSGMSYDTLNIEDMVLVDGSNQVVEGNFKPSIEVPMHVGIYNTRPDVQAIVHTHSTYAKAFGVARKSLPVILDEIAQVIGHEVTVADYAVAGTDELADNIITALGKDKYAVFMAHHGLITLGSSMADALKKAHIIERACEVCIYAQVLGGINTLDKRDIEALNKNFKHYGQKKI